MNCISWAMNCIHFVAIIAIYFAINEFVMNSIDMFDKFYESLWLVYEFLWYNHKCFMKFVAIL